MSARTDILSSIRMRRAQTMARPSRYIAPPAKDDLLTRFAERATAESADLHILERMEDVPDAVADILRARNMAARIHLPPDPRTDLLPWSAGTALVREPPGPNDVALAVVPFAVAETGTLVFISAPETPPSWHFRPGLEIAVLAAGNILARLEDVLARLRENQSFPSTVNLVTGPSRTGDIEQTLELGAHGPKALSILVVKG